MKILAIIAAVIIYLVVVIFMWKDGYKHGKHDGAVDEQIKQKKEFEKAVKDAMLFPQEIRNIVPVQAAFELPLATSKEEAEKQRAWAYDELTNLIDKEIKQYINFYDCENLRHCKRTYKAKIEIVDRRNWFIEKGQQT